MANTDNFHFSVTAWNSEQRYQKTPCWVSCMFATTNLQNINRDFNDLFKYHKKSAANSACRNQVLMVRINFYDKEDNATVC